MAYTKNPTWVDGTAGGTPITAATLQHIEDGIAAATRPPLRYPSSYRRVSGVWRPA